MNPESLALTIKQFIDSAPLGVVTESGELLFRLDKSDHSISSQRDRCTLQLWSADRNCVRRVLNAEERKDSLHLTVTSLSQPKPRLLKICRDEDRAQPTERRERRESYDQLLRRVIERSLPGSRLVAVKSARDLQHSFGPAYARGLLRYENSSCAIVGVNRGESQATVDGALTVGILWLEHLRLKHARSTFVRGLKLFLPAGSSATVRARARHMTLPVEVYEINERQSECRAVALDSLMRAPQLVYCPNRHGAEERFAPQIKKIREICPECEVAIMSPSEVSFRWCGVEFATARISGNIQCGGEVVFGARPVDTVLDESTEDLFRRAVRKLCDSRQPGRARPNDLLWRMEPTRWMESQIQSYLTIIDHSFDSHWCYSGVPSIDVPSRPLADLLTITHDKRLAVIVAGTEENMHFAVQSLDSWSRVSELHQQGLFTKLGYFKDIDLSPELPLLYMVMPVLHVHPEFDTVVKQLFSDVDWQLVAVNETWRTRLQVLYRKRRRSTPA